MSPRKPAPPTRMQRHGNGHSYFLDGEKVPGVTTILSNGIPKPGLVGWAGNTVADFVVNALRVADGHVIADDLVREALAWNATRQQHAVKVADGEKLPRLALAKILGSIRYRDVGEAAAKGTDVHRLAERLARGEEVEVAEHLEGHVRSYLRFLEEWDPTEALLERVVVHRRWRYMGKLDLLCRVADGTRWLFDVKTARSGVFAETALQLAGYRYAESMLDGDGEVPMPEVDRCGVIWVRADGYDVIPFDVTERTFRTFLYAKQVGEWLDYREGPAATVKGDALAPPRRKTA